MSTTTERIACLLACALAMPVAMAADGPPYGFGKTATSDDLGRFTSPLPDGRGFPAGRGSVADGEKVYQA
ncbi:MAG: cytochrome c, partial [Burkholderiaceae bacterium]